MKIVDTSISKPEDLTYLERDWIYNGLDAAVAREVIDVLLPQLDNATAATYAFSCELQAPVLEMRLRGVRVDMAARSEAFDAMFEASDRISRNLEEIALAGVGMPQFNWRSNPDLQELFYARLGVPEVRKKGKPTVDRDALERIQQYTIAEPLVCMVIALKDLEAKIKVLKTAIDPDGRIRTSYNIAGTSTGRFSSSFSEFGTGGNLQNIEESLRRIFISDPGMKFAKFDAKSGESFCVGAKEWNLFRDGRFLDACESGDPHTAVARICWPSLPWTGVLARDKSIAEQPYYRHYTYRFMCKKLGHGSNYGGRPATLAQQSRLPLSVVQQFQPLYFRAFPAHQLWHAWVEEQLRRYGALIALSGRKRHFWGRRNEDSTLREAIAYDPQGSLADIVNTGMLHCWRANRAALMMQDHDATTWMYPEEIEDEIVPWLLENLTIPVELSHGRTLRIPYDAKVGWNKGEYCCGDKSKPECKSCKRETNLDGLKDWSPQGDKRKRAPQVSLLDRRVR